LDPVGTGIVSELLLVCLEAIPLDVAVVDTRHYELPLRPRHCGHGGTAVGTMTGACSAIDEGASVTRIVQYLENARMLRKSPQKFAFVAA
jgi:hypothetical protein